MRQFKVVGRKFGAEPLGIEAEEVIEYIWLVRTSKTLGYVNSVRGIRNARDFSSDFGSIYQVVDSWRR